MRIKNPAAVALGRLGGSAGVGAAKRRDPAIMLPILAKARAAKAAKKMSKMAENPEILYTSDKRLKESELQ